jgi:hypothetical protein
MKIATAHKLKGDHVTFVRGIDTESRKRSWNQVYIATSFTFRWRQTVDTVRFYSQGNVRPIVGGILASLMPAEFQHETGITPHIGPLNGSLRGAWKAIRADRDLAVLADDIAARGVDSLPPDYGIFDKCDVPYREALDECYILRASKGCNRGCDFCGVRILEPTYVSQIALSARVSYIARHWKEKANLLLLDDNILLSPQFDRIIDEIRDLGFAKGARLDGKLRYVDFNQGLDIRLLQKKHLKKLAQIELRPIRLAFDNVALQTMCKHKLQWVLDNGFREISVYVLYNHTDTPEDLYRRLGTMCRINASHGSRIYSFPMKYIPCNAMDRKHLGQHWTRRQVRGVQCILNASHGIAPTQPDFFRRAFGRSIQQFLQIIQMPENYIVYRSKYSENGHIQKWQECYEAMSATDRRIATGLIANGKGTIAYQQSNKKIAAFLRHYANEYETQESGTP